jgi:hypothetical protein
MTITTATTTKRNKYLNNKDLLLQIHRSKNTYGSFVDKKYEDYDLILGSLDKINIRTVAQAKKNRAKRLGQQLYASKKAAGIKDVKLIDCVIDYKKVPKEDVVFRIMTHEHIPLAPGRKKTVKSTADAHERCNFPPYQHWAFDNKDNLICVGKSHWKGDLKKGFFSKEHGRITEELGRMFLMLAERYAQRSNWRGYTYVDEMKGQAILQLSQIGLQFDESKSENPFAYYTAAVTNSFTRVLNIEKRNQNIRDDMLEQNGLTPSFTRQNQQEYAEETARQAALYKGMRQAKSDEDSDEEV